MRENLFFFRNFYYTKTKKLHVSSTYAKILGETYFHTREFPRSGSKAKDREKKRTMATLPRVAHAKPPGPMYSKCSLVQLGTLVSKILMSISAQNTQNTLSLKRSK